MAMESKNLELTGFRPPSVASSRPLSSRSSTRPHSGYHTVKQDSNVDELLFKSHHPTKLEETVDFEAPWCVTPREKRKPKIKPQLWSPDDRSSLSSQATRADILRRSNKMNSHSHDGLNRYRPVKYTASFCDETLFGPRLDEPSFESPWGEKSKKQRPFMFSPIDYTKLMQENATNSDKRYSSAGTLDGRPPSRQGRRPATASTRPVTVETASGVKAPVWKP